jgi:hypothetical protein
LMLALAMAWIPCYQPSHLLSNKPKTTTALNVIMPYKVLKLKWFYFSYQKDNIKICFMLLQQSSDVNCIKKY